MAETGLTEEAGPEETRGGREEDKVIHHNRN